MFRFLSRGFRILVANGGVHLVNSSTDLGFNLNRLPFTVRFFSEYVNQERPFVVSYLINSCGLSPESAKSVSKRIDFKTSDRPDSVLCLLKGYGFTISHVSKLLKSDPWFLLADPEKVLLPKLGFLSSIGISTSHLPEIVSLNPYLLRRSLSNYLIPTYKMLKTILGSDELAFQSLGRCIWIMSDMHESFPVNIALLRELKVPQKKISTLLIQSPSVVCKDPNKFRENVNRVIEIGMDPSEKLFVHALQVTSQRSHKVWEQKIEVYKSLGLSEEQILLAFRKFPYLMAKSERKIRSIMDFVVNKMGYQPEYIVCFPAIVSFSLEKRIVPRFSVVRVLQLKGLVKTDISIAYVMKITEMSFVNNYVIEYEGKIPELMSIYKGQKSIQELGFQFHAEKHVAAPDASVKD